MSMKLKLIRGILLSMALVLSACGGSQATPETPTVDPGAVLTAAAQTANARMTEMAAVTPTPEPSPTEAFTPTVTQGITPTTGAPVPTQPDVTQPAFTQPAATQPPAGNVADRMQFVADVTVPDGTSFDPGQSFTKTWRLQNAGTTTWTTSYSLVFFGGEQMGGPNAVPVPSEVAPGGTVDISVNLTAPAENGNYIGYWIMRNAAGANFGLGPNADQAIYVEINVGEAQGTAAAPGSTQVASLTATPSSSGSGGDVVSSITWMGDDSYRGACPAQIVVTGQFVLEEAASVSYFLEVNVESGSYTAGTSLAKQTKQFQAGTHQVAYTLNFPESTIGTIEFNIDAPEVATTGPEPFEVQCQG